MKAHSEIEASPWDEILAAVRGDVENTAGADFDIDVDLSALDDSEECHARSSYEASSEQSQTSGR
jgi:hypothetical protein